MFLLSIRQDECVNLEKVGGGGGAMAPWSPGSDAYAINSKLSIGVQNPHRPIRATSRWSVLGVIHCSSCVNFSLLQYRKLTAAASAPVIAAITVPAR